jgi:hypothetical protein
MTAGNLTPGYVDNLLAPERRAKNPSSSDIINGFSLDNDDSYNHQPDKTICWLYYGQRFFCLISASLSI